MPGSNPPGTPSPTFVTETEAASNAPSPSVMTRLTAPARRTPQSTYSAGGAAADYVGRSGRAHAVPPSGQRRNCFSIPTAPRKMDQPASAMQTPPSTAYRVVPLAVSSTHERLKGGGITPLPRAQKKPRGAAAAAMLFASDSHNDTLGGTGRRRRDGDASTPGADRGRTPAASAPSWKARRTTVALDDEAGLIAALKSMPTDDAWVLRNKSAAWTSTSVDRSAGYRQQLGTAMQTPPPGKYDTPAPQMGTPASCKGGRISTVPRFRSGSPALATPGPGAYSLSTGPRLQPRGSGGTDFSKAPGGRCLGGGGYFVTKRSASALDVREIGGGGDLRNLLAPGPGAYDGASDTRAAFRTSRVNELSPVAAAFLAQRIPFDRTQMSPAVISDMVHVRTVAEDIARHRLRS